MALNTQSAPASAPRMPLVLLSVGLLAVILLVGGLASIALRQVDGLTLAYSDNTQYSIAQLDVDTMRFQLAIEALEAGEMEDLEDLRLRFDILYSRVEMFRRRHMNGEDFIALDPMTDLATLEAEVRALVPLIDGPGDALRAALPMLSERMERFAETARAVSTRGAQRLSAIADTRREALREMLLNMAVLVLAMLLGISVLAFILMRLWQLSRARADAVSRAEQQMRTVVDTAFDAIFVCDSDGVIRDYNNTAARMFQGDDGPGLTGQPFIDTVFDPVQTDAPSIDPGTFLAAATDESGGPLAVSARDAEGRMFPAELSIDQVHSKAGRMTVIFLRDVSERRQAEADLTQARDQALAGERTKAQFLAVMSHEMRTPLNGLLGTVQLLEDTPLDTGQRSLVKTMRGSGDHLLSLVNDILELTEFEAGEIRLESTEVDLAQLLNGIVASTRALAEAQHDSLGWRFIGPPVMHMVSDPRRLRQILLNLVGNAIKFTRDGSIDIEVERLSGVTPMLEIRVCDTGVGIVPDQRENVFMDFARIDSSYARQVGGTGLGLGIARRLARLMGGDVGLDPARETGSVFWLRLPLEIPATLPVRSDTRPSRKAPSAPTVPLDLLVVEDNQVNAMILSEFLRRDGHTVTVARSGQEGLERARATRFDGIFMDISMPGMDGITAARLIRGSGGGSADTPIVAVTAHALPSEQAEFRAAGMSETLSKPVDRERLRACVAGMAPPVELAGQDAPLLDPDRLNQLRRLSNPALLRDLCQKFLAETDAAVATLGDPELPLDATREITHKIASSAAAMGLARLSARLSEIERQAKQSGDAAQTPRESLPELWAESRAALVDAIEQIARPAA
ncbi:response regulator [Maribius pontilimi]|uniref:histidine kinase n=1 Tax=Palleronia pontilimi TaxID=1964209 RepID=A0A934ICZ2_9RHOB|nr:PAS domain-containing hybrid sensor histidine kinase/response regulator [Palleronia pontilimi]MBJ3763371.1 response regulator [Palleronia pontilimi]